MYVLNLFSQRLFYGFPKLILPSFLPVKIQGAAGAYRGGNDCDYCCLKTLRLSSSFSSSGNSR